MRLKVKEDAGSAVTGFALVTPLLIAVFIAVIGVSSVVRHRAVLGAAASCGVRVASAYGSSDIKGRTVAAELVRAHGYDVKKMNILISHPIVNGVRLVEVEVRERIRVPWIDREVMVSQKAREVDEGGLL